MHNKPLRVKLLGLDSKIDWKRLSPYKDYRIDNIQFIFPNEEWEDFIIVFGSSFSSPIKTKCNKERRIFIAAEPANYKRYDEKFLDQFGVVITTDPNCKHNNTINLPPAIPWHIGRFFESETKAWLFDKLQSWSPKKTKLCSVICSNKTCTKEHRARIEFVEKLKLRFGNDIDFYGRGFNTIEDKIEALSEYRFHIALENTPLANYWTEKIADPFISLTYPIYWGCSNLEEYFDPQSFTRIDINHPERALKIIEQILSSDIDKRNHTFLEKSKSKVLYEYNIFSAIHKILLTKLDRNELPSDFHNMIIPETQFHRKTVVISMLRQVLPYNILKKLYYKITQISNSTTITSRKIKSCFYKIKSYFSPHSRWLRVMGDETLRLDYVLTEKDIVIDGGGYKDAWSAQIFSRFNSYIYIFEPENSFTKVIKKHFKAGNPKIRILEGCLSNEDGEAHFFEQGDASSIQCNALKNKKAKTVKKFDISNFITINKIKEIALLKLDIEGEEYNVLARLIETCDIKIIKDIQVQFHLFDPDAKQKYASLRKELIKTHYITWRYPFVWENWRRRNTYAK